MTSPIRGSLETIARRRQALLKILLRPEPLVIGTVCEALRRCGTSSCHCAGKPGHRQTILLYGKKGRRTSRFIREEDRAWVRKAWRRYLGCKGAVRELRALNDRELGLLRAQIKLRGERFPL